MTLYFKIYGSSCLSEKGATFENESRELFTYVKLSPDLMLDV